MADTLKSLIAKAGEWIDIYRGADIEVGTKIAVQNIGSSDLQLASTLIMPELNSDTWQKIQPNDFPMANSQGDRGAWVFSPNQDGKINVWIIP